MVALSGGAPKAGTAGTVREGDSPVGRHCGCVHLGSQGSPRCHREQEQSCAARDPIDQNSHAKRSDRRQRHAPQSAGEPFRGWRRRPKVPSRSPRCATPKNPRAFRCPPRCITVQLPLRTQPEKPLSQQGAASDAQIRKELGEEQHAEAQARAAQQRVLTPVAGGFSVGGNGTIPIPTGVPEAIQRVVAGGNAIADFPYIWGGGHASFIANGYDCSGSVSYALAAGGLLSAPLVSGDLANWGEPGPGRWITIYANAGHTFMDVNGMWFDTAGRSGPYASRWLVSQPSLAGYAVRHPPGF